ncbi:MAG: hypothetical protein IPK94_00485 [Saprospiraceae bacterium]|nr:hypothetical protein [Saprospiraceae bacterium]
MANFPVLRSHPAAVIWQALSVTKRNILRYLKRSERDPDTRRQVDEGGYHPGRQWIWLPASDRAFLEWKAKHWGEVIKVQ